MTKTGSLIYQIRVSLNEIQPPIWRRLQVPGSMRLSTLHETLQIVMGWEGYHLHSFKIGGQRYTDPAFDEHGELEMEDEGLYELSELVKKEGQRFIYEYDFGDSWRHTLRVEKFLPAEKDAQYPRCTGGKRAGPPEDVGGPMGYRDFLQAIADPKLPEHHEYLTWIGGAFEPEAFDLPNINRTLGEVIRERGAEPFGDWLAKNALFVHIRMRALPDWPGDLPEEDRGVAEHSPLRRDAVALLTYLRDKDVRGTRSLGNLTLKAAREVSQAMVDPPPLEHRIGERVYSIRSADEIRALYLVHALTWVGELAAGGPGRTWRLTAAGEAFLEAAPPEQVWLLFTTWWFRTNWSRVTPLGFAGDSVPFSLRDAILDHLLLLPTERLIDFKPFADQVIQSTGLIYPIDDKEWARKALRGLIEDFVIDPLSQLGILSTEYEPDKLLGGRYKRPVAFQITPLGRSLLEAL